MLIHFMPVAYAAINIIADVVACFVENSDVQTVNAII